jgi:hypothetical protein
VLGVRCRFCVNSSYHQSVEDPNPVPGTPSLDLRLVRITKIRNLTLIPIEGPIRRPERGGEWEPIKILLQRENSAYTPNSQPRIPTQVCQGHVVTTHLPTLGTNPKRSQSGSTTQEAKDLAVLQQPLRTVREPGADGPLPTGGRSNKHNRTTKQAHQKADGPYLVLRRSASNWCRVDGPRPLGGRSGPHADGPVPLRGRSDKPLLARNSWPNGSKRRRSRTRDEHEEP